MPLLKPAEQCIMYMGRNASSIIWRNIMTSRGTHLTTWVITISLLSSSWSSSSSSSSPPSPSPPSSICSGGVPASKERPIQNAFPALPIPGQHQYNQHDDDHDDHDGHDDQDDDDDDDGHDGGDFDNKRSRTKPCFGFASTLKIRHFC